MTTNAKASFPWLLLGLWAVAGADSETLVEQAYVNMKVPPGYFQGRVAHHGGSQAECGVACTIGGNCTAYVHHVHQDGSSSCSLGVLNPSLGPFVMANAWNGGLSVMLRPDKVLINNLKAPYIGFLRDAETMVLDLFFLAGSTVTLPAIPEPADVQDRFGVTNYKGDVVACGGQMANVVIKKCWILSLLTGAWSELPGELSRGHFSGQLVAVESKLWMIMGKNVRTGEVHKKVESYNILDARWKEEPDANVDIGVSHFSAVVFDKTKVRSVSPRIMLCFFNYLSP